ncbi:UDP-GlcNAc--UDP-phosphate GlcNAc-1-phosphate transferase [Polaribacter undariae]|uniref:UDP-GlcNAc--UDP-phosphate GlcNAc-1-phosphate transferase n=1 Tax=Polaribacter sejongensis TaxID=985043 RepID=A0AAJ1QWG6_9FLAO|nr:UDP-GlcNAc--UDP-phosphate GlcNAc-1-phosphate transferase [Polaribacter undariae]MDN3619158.1 UDP-GlcNAc--UDP-phosphate GlcNAc-1-phosphate transferase [Polaribacter undariae]UWD33641.1 UDP-GlcNAc--UDP-phosphate GlcNAc-1-phosphate transferase [Polaribacter undariae]
MEKNLIVLCILIVASFLYLKLANKFNIVDKPNERSSHTKVTIRGGGIIFPVAILLFFFINDFLYPFFVLGLFLISFVSFLDDIYTLSSRVRFPFQIIAISLILFQAAFPVFPLYYSVLCLVLGVAVINMFNFMDGINGITGMYSLAVLSGMYFINLNEAIVHTDLIVFSGLSLLVFGFYNFRKKALFFAGDIGSIAIGMLLFFIGFLFVLELHSPILLLLILVYGVDTALTMLYRIIYTKESILDPHRHHVYQKLVDVSKISHLKVSLGYGVLQLVVNFIILKTYKLDMSTQLIVFFGVIILFILLYIFLFRLLAKKAKMNNAT